MIINSIKNAFNTIPVSKSEKFLKVIEKEILEDDTLLEEPKYLFFEFIKLIRIIFEDDIFSNHELEFIIYDISKLLSINKNKVIEGQSKVIENIEKITEKIVNIDNKLKEFILAIFRLSLRITFWWFCNNGTKNLNKVIKKNIATSVMIESKIVASKMKILIKNEVERLNRALSNDQKELKIVTKTIEKFIPIYKNLRVTRIPTPRMLIEKNNETLSLNQLSDGEKNMIAMVGDIARRLSMANPSMDNPLEGDGIVMIDEVDLHLHPKWQRLIISKLVEVFPNTQFIVTTHSPQILSHVKAENIFLLKQEEDNISVTKPTESYGKSTNRQLEDILGVEARPLEIKKDLHKLFKLIQEMDLEGAKTLMNKLEDKIEGREPELVKANVLIQRKEILGK